MFRKPFLFFAALMALAILGAAQNPPTTPATQAPQTTAAPATPGPVKLALVNIQQAVMTCDEGKQEDAKLQQYIGSKNDEAQKRQKDLEAKKNTFEVQGSKLTDEARADMADEIDRLDTELQRFQQDTQKEIDGRRQRWQAAIAKKMLAVIAKVAKDKSLDMVEFYDPNRDGYVNPALVITDEVIKAYNIANPVTPAAAPVKK